LHQIVFRALQVRILGCHSWAWRSSWPVNYRLASEFLAILARLLHAAFSGTSAICAIFFALACGHPAS
jgi:hypothetical protein